MVRTPIRVKPASAWTFALTQLRIAMASSQSLPVM
jgi:hypothetical protein